MKRFLIAFGAVCVLAASLTGIVYLLRYQQQVRVMRQFIAAGPANLARQQSAARQEGIFLDPGQLQKSLPPPGQNAAPLYEKLMQLLKDKPLNLPVYGERGMSVSVAYTPEQVAAVRKILAARQDVVMLVHQAADKPQCVFTRSWNKDYDVTFPEYQPMRSATRLLETESYLLARDGNYQEAVINQARGFRIAKHAASDHLLISYLVGNANEAITFAGMQNILALAGPNAAVDANISTAATVAPSNLSLWEALRTEPALQEQMFRNLHSLQNQQVAALSATLDSLTSRGNIKSDAQGSAKPISAAERKLFSNIIDAQNADYLSDMCRIVRTVDVAEPKRGYELASILSASTQRKIAGSKTVSSILVPFGMKLDDDECRIHAREAITLAAATILSIKANLGVFPNNLPPGFINSYTNKPLQYRREGDNGFIVYNVGPTGHFDGGKPGQNTRGVESLFRYPPVPLPVPADQGR